MIASTTLRILASRKSHLFIIFLGTYVGKKTCQPEKHQRLTYPNLNLLSMFREESYANPHLIYTTSPCTCIHTTRQYQIEHALKGFYLDSTIFMKASSFCEFDNISSILRRFANSFSKGFVKKETEKIKIDKKELKTDKNYTVKRCRLANN